ncbi:30S ribosomal protein S11 [Candidatus Pacearchaeota archaeon]|jgi:ribosomal protein S11|nr:30S ribosomal protein S11 [Candidatus Pacearchaeota archaeon]|tara:strand:+ start:932 stop:1438 length:507 start_codon:yes stop_codon:yes gene_type:complete
MAKKKEKEEKTEEKEEKVEEKAEAPKEKTEELQEPVKRKSEKPKEERSGIAYIYSSSNNTIVHITDLAGNTISRVSGGMITKHSRLKSNPTIAMFVAKKASERARDLGINALYVRLKGKTTVGNTGPGSHSAVKALGKEGFRIVNILDTTKYPRGGPKKKGGKRGRRV